MILNNTLKNCKSFDKEQTNVAKGVACILLLYHHLFYNSDEYYTLFTPLWKAASGVPIECLLSPIAKICVMMFVILSGYGINATMRNDESRGFAGSVRIALKQLWKLWTNYIIIFLLFVPWQPLANHMPYQRLLDCVIDVSGLAFLFHTPTMNATWWYMTIAIISYLVSPLLRQLVRLAGKKKYLSLSLLVAFGFFVSRYFAYSNVFYYYGFLTGMLLNELNVFEMAAPLYRGKTAYSAAVCLPLLITVFFWCFLEGNKAFLLSSIAIIAVSYVCLSKIPGLNRILNGIGKHSGNIFMFHTFLFLYDAQNIVYAPQYAPIILTLFLVECVFISWLIEKLKECTGIHRLTSNVGRKISGVSAK